MPIPRTIHQIWVGPRPAPTEWMETWRTINPELEYQLWDGAAIESFGLLNEELYLRFLEAGLYDGAADVARIEILHRSGGVYVDADSIALRPIAGATFMQAGFFAVREPPDRQEPPVARSPLVSNAFMGAVPGHPLLARCTDRHATVGRGLKPMWRLTGPGMLTEVLSSDPGEEFTVLPASTFFTRSLTGEPVTGEDPYAEHMWSTTTERWGFRGGSPYPA